jgi:SAM-dependent methyltransferase
VSVPYATTIEPEKEYWVRHYRRSAPYIHYNGDEYRAIVSLLGGDGLRGKLVLDLGCGQGVWTRNMALLGAHVVPVDLDPGIVDEAEVAAGRERAHGAAGDMHALPFADGAFDAIVGSMVLHHAQDHAHLGREIARVLAPVGVAVFHENAGRNPVLMWARDHVVGRFGVPRNSSPGEHPLRDDELAEIGQAFDVAEAHVGRLFLVQLAVKYLLHTERGTIFALARRLDDWLYRALPRVRRWSYYQIVVLRRSTQWGAD